LVATLRTSPRGKLYKRYHPWHGRRLDEDRMANDMFIGLTCLFCLIGLSIAVFMPGNSLRTSTTQWNERIEGVIIERLPISGSIVVGSGDSKRIEDDLEKLTVQPANGASIEMVVPRGEHKEPNVNVRSTAPGKYVFVDPPRSAASYRISGILLGIVVAGMLSLFVSTSGYAITIGLAEQLNKRR
jgi:hypothetical protein